MADLTHVDIAVVLCQADAESLDALVLPGHGARAVRTAPDEYLFVCEPAAAPEVVREAADRIAALDPDAVVLDVSDGWAAVRVAGDDTPRAFSYLSQLDPPPPGAFAQGDVAHVAAKVLGADDGLTILVPAYWRDHLRERIVRDGHATEVPA